MDRFLIFGLGRSGTTSLISALNVDRNVVHEPFSSGTGDVAANEAFNRILEANGYLPQDLPESAGEYSFNRFHFIALDQSLCHRYLEQLYQAFTGVKHVWNTVSREANVNILSWCFENDIKVIFQTREALGRSVVSRLLAEQSRVWFLGSDLEHKGHVESHRYRRINVVQLRAELRFLEQHLQFYQDYLKGKPYHRITFEALYLQHRKNQEKEVEKLCAFLSIPVSELDPANLENYIYEKARKQTTDEVLKRVPNYRAFRKFL